LTDRTPEAHVRAPMQARSRKTLERIVRAALEILEEEGVEALTVQSVVARAESSVGSFYARFGGKDDLLEYLRARVWEEARDRWDDALENRSWTGLDLGGVAEGAVRLLVDAAHSRAVYLRALDQAVGHDRDGFGTFRRHVLVGLGELLLSRRAEITHTDPDLAVQVGLASVSGLVDATDPTSGGPFPREVLVREGRALLMAYLAGAPPGDGDEDGDVDFFDVWG